MTLESTIRLPATEFREPKPLKRGKKKRQEKQSGAGRKWGEIRARQKRKKRQRMREPGRSFLYTSALHSHLMTKNHSYSTHSQLFLKISAFQMSPLGPKVTTPFGGLRRPRKMILGKNRHGRAETLDGNGALAQTHSIPTRSGVRAVQETNRRADTEKEVQPKAEDWKIHRRGASPSLSNGPMDPVRGPPILAIPRRLVTTRVPRRSEDCPSKSINSLVCRGVLVFLLLPLSSFPAASIATALSLFDPFLYCCPILHQGVHHPPIHDCLNILRPSHHSIHLPIKNQSSWLPAASTTSPPLCP